MPRQQAARARVTHDAACAQLISVLMRDDAVTEPMLTEALYAIVRTHAADSGTIHFLGPDGLLHLAAHTDGMPPPVLAIISKIPIGKGMAGLAVERQKPVTACNIQTDTSGDVRPGARATGMEGAIVVPILAGDTVVGALGIANQSERTFQNDEIDRLLQAGRALARTRPAVAG